MFEVFKPELVWIEGRCYRVNDSYTEINSLEEHDFYENDLNIDSTDADMEGDEDFEVISIGSNRFTAQLHVPKYYVGSVIGKKGVTKMGIERDTMTEIKIPRHGQGGSITVNGSTASNVNRALCRINMAVMSSRMRQRPTHFVSIPLNDPVIMEKFLKFKETVLDECLGRGVHEDLFISPHKLHLTVGVMCLMDDEERLQASNLLAMALEKVIIPMIQGHLPLKIRVRGLAYMNDDPSDISVLYSRVEDEGSDGMLQQISDAIYRFFIKKGFMFKQFNRDTVLLHVTLMSKKYRSKGQYLDNKSYHSLETFDGSKMLEKYSDWDFGVTSLKEIHISQMHSETDQYYPAVSVISV